MKKALIIAAAVNLLLCSGVQALSASGWVPGVERISEFTDANGDLFYVRNWGEDGIMPADLVDGFELPPDTYEILEDGTFVPPTILNITSVDGSNIPNPTKWRQTGKSFEIVSSVDEMTDPSVEYILRDGVAKTGVHYQYKEAFGDHGVPVYEKLPETVVEGQTIVVDGRKYVGRVKPVYGRHYTNAVSLENITIDGRYNSGGELDNRDGYIAITDIEIPKEIQERARNGEIITVRFKGVSLENNQGFAYATLQYYDEGALIFSWAASQIYTQKDTDPQSDENVWTFQLYYTTTPVKDPANVKYSTSAAKGDTMILSGGVKYNEKVPFKYDLSQIVVTFDEIIGETWEDKLVWDFVADYAPPMPAGFYPAESLDIVDMEEDMEDVRHNYVLSIDGHEYFYADYMNAMLRLPNGDIRYYLDGTPQHAMTQQDFDGNYYYINHTGYAVRNGSYTITDEKGKNLLPAGTYTFNDLGVCTTLPVVIDGSNPDDIRNGLVRVPNGGVRYLVDGVAQHAGLVRDVEGHYYYINHLTYAVTNCSYIVTEQRGNNLIPGGVFTFDKNGYITNLPEVIDGSNPDDLQNGLLRFSDGSVRYLVNGMPIHAGIVTDIEGNIYYINHTTYAVRDVYYPVWKTNGLLGEKGYSFDHNGVMMDTAVPPYWTNELNSTIQDVQNLKEQFGDKAISFVQITDMHVDNGNKSQQWLGALVANVMNSCDIPFTMITGDSNTRAAYERPTPSIITENMELADQHLSAIGWNRIARILGNHDGMWGYVNGVYYARSMSMAEKYQTFCGRQMAAYEAYCTILVDYAVNEKAPYDAYYYLDDEDTKVRYINLNSHWAEYTVDEDYLPTFNTFTGMYYYGQKQLEWLATEALDVEDGWTVIVFTHVPPTKEYGPVVKNGDCVLYRSMDQYVLLGILNAYAGRTAYSESFTLYNDWRNINISVDFSKNSANTAKGEIAGVFSGHSHTDSINYESSKYFPVISLRTAEGMGAGDRYETAFDTVVINPETKRIHMIRTGVGFNRTAKYTPDGKGVTILGGTLDNPEVSDD